MVASWRHHTMRVVNAMRAMNAVRDSGSCRAKVHVWRRWRRCAMWMAQTQRSVVLAMQWWGSGALEAAMAGWRIQAVRWRGVRHCVRLRLVKHHLPAAMSKWRYEGRKWRRGQLVLKAMIVGYGRAQFSRWLRRAQVAGRARSFLGIAVVHGAQALSRAVLATWRERSELWNRHAAMCAKVIELHSCCQLALESLSICVAPPSLPPASLSYLPDLRRSCDGSARNYLWL